MIQQQLRKEMVEAMRAKDTVRLTTIRGLISSFTNELVSKKKKPNEELSDEDALVVIARAAKQRKDSIEQFEKGDRNDLAEKEKEELKIIESYLPQMLSMEEVEKVVMAKKEELGITDKAEMGKLIGAVMQELKGKADGADVKKVVEKLLS